jgi:hypothetical protein
MPSTVNNTSTKTGSKLMQPVTCLNIMFLIIQIQEFGNETLDADGKGFAAALNSTNADGTTKAETVVRIHSSSHDHDHPLKSNISSSSESVASAAIVSADPQMDKAVDRIIDQHDNEFVLSKSSSTVSALTLDPQVSSSC